MSIVEVEEHVSMVVGLGAFFILCLHSSSMLTSVIRHIGVSLTCW